MNFGVSEERLKNLKVTLKRNSPERTFPELKDVVPLLKHIGFFEKMIINDE